MTEDAWAFLGGDIFPAESHGEGGGVRATGTRRLSFQPARRAADATVISPFRAAHYLSPRRVVLSWRVAGSAGERPTGPPMRSVRKASSAQESAAQGRQHGVLGHQRLRRGRWDHRARGLGCTSRETSCPDVHGALNPLSLRAIPCPQEQPHNDFVRVNVFLS